MLSLDWRLRFQLWVKMVLRKDKVLHQPYVAIPAYQTKDGSEIRELMHPGVHGNVNQSLAEATVPVGAATWPHLHHMAEELYHILRGRGMMTRGDERFEVVPGDTIGISPGTVHCIENIGPVPLVLLCCCSPAYSHEDTILV